MIKLVLLRHGESLWNKKNLFTGWVDVDLSKRGIKQARQAGRLLQQRGFSFDLTYTSVLKRAVRTLWLALDEMDLMWLPIINAWQLNERHYGDLQGLNKKKMAKKFGAEQIKIWRRSYDVRPPILKANNPFNINKDPRYKIYGLKKIPGCESLADTCRRVMPYWRREIMPKILDHKKIIISAHGNSLRALIKHLDNISNKDIVNLEIPVGQPLIYEFDIKNQNLIKRKSYYLK